MRNFKKVVALVLAVVLTMSTFTVAFAAEETSATKLATLGLLLNTTDAELGAGLTREIGLTMILKSLGYTQADADAAAATTPFTDVTNWAKGWAALAAAKGITTGTTATTFAPKAVLTKKEFVAFQLRALGYNTADAWAKAAELGATAGLVATGDALDATTFTKANAADVMLAALKATVQGVTPAVTLLDQLIAKGVTTLEKAIAAGLKVGTLAITSATATANNAITVKFNKAVADTTKVAITATRDLAKVTFSKTTWNADKTEAVLSVSYKLLEGSYVVTVKEDTLELVAPAFAVTAEKVASITFPSDYVVLNEAGDELYTTVVIKNQYNEDVTDNYDENDIDFTAAKLDNPITLEDGTVTIPSDAYDEGDKLTLTAVDPESGVVGSKTFTVTASINIASIVLGDVATDETSSTIYVSDLEDANSYWVPLTITDTNGNVVTNEDTLEADLTVISSDDDVIADESDELIADLIGKEDGKPVLYLIAGADIEAKDVTMTIVSKSGKTATKTIKVLADGMIDKFTVSKPSEVVKAGVEFELPYTAVDQFGAALTEASGAMVIDNNDVDEVLLGDQTKDAETQINVTNGTITADKDYSNGGKLVLNVTPDADASGSKVTIKVSTSTGNSQTLQLAVNDAPIPSSIESIDKDFYTGVQSGLTETLSIDDVMVVDQYGDEVDLAVDTNEDGLVDGTDDVFLLTLDTTVDTSTAKFDDPTMTFVDDDAVDFIAQDNVSGARKFKIVLTNDTEAETKDEYALTMTNVQLKDITEFGVVAFDKLYTSDAPAYINADSTEYDVDVEIYGKKSTMNVYVHQGLLKSVSSTIFEATDNDVDTTDATASEDIGFVFAAGGDNEADTDGADKTTTITVGIEGATGIVTATKDLTYSDATPKCKSIVLRDDDDEVVSETSFGVDAADLALGVEFTEADGLANIYALDQYGIEYLDDNLTYKVSTYRDADDEVVTGRTTTVTFVANVATVTSDVVAGESFIITITKNGVSKNVKIIAE